MARGTDTREIESAIDTGARIDWIDVAKGFGIILVVIGHVHMPRLDAWIYHFHMPMFFMLSGIVFKPGDSGAFAAKRVRSLLIPYASFMVLITLIDNAVVLFDHARLGQVIINDVRHIPREIYGGRKLVGEYGAMWFITCLFVSLILYNLARQKLGDVLSAPMVALMAFLFLLSYVVAPIASPWNLTEVPLAIVFIWLGEVWIRSFGTTPLSKIGRSPLTSLAFLVALVGYLVAQPLDLKGGYLGTPIITAVVALAWSHVIILGCRLLAQFSTPRDILQRFGSASLVILFMHRVFTDRAQLPLHPLLVAAIAIAISYICYLVLRQAGPVPRFFFLGEALPRRDSSTRRPFFSFVRLHHDVRNRSRRFHLPAARPRHDRD